MKYSILLAFCLVASVSSFGQYLDNTMTWTEHYNWLFGGNGARGYMDYTLSIPTDTVISGMQYYRIERNGIQVDTNLSLFWPGNPLPPVISVVSDQLGFLREAGEVFYYKPSASSPEYVLFDFSAEVGDSIGSFEIESIDTVVYAGQQRRRYWSTVGNLSTYALEGVGHTFGGLLHAGIYAYHDWWALVCAGVSSMPEPYLLDSSMQCSVDGVTLEFELPCVVPTDSVHISAGPYSAFVFNGDTLGSLFFSDPGTFSGEVFDSISGNSYSVEVHVSPAEVPIENFLVSSNTFVCPGDSLWVCGQPGQDGYAWSTGTTTECILITHEWCWEGTISLYAADAQGCVHEYYPIDISCGDSVTANFTWDHSLEEILFENTSVNATAYSWDLGDGTFSTETNPSNYYIVGGSYEVCLVAENGCMSDTLCQTILVGTDVGDMGVEPNVSVVFLGQTLSVSAKGETIRQLSIHDISGRLVYVRSNVNESSCDVDVSALRKGVFVLGLDTSSGTHVSKRFVR